MYSIFFIPPDFWFFIKDLIYFLSYIIEKYIKYWNKSTSTSYFYFTNLLSLTRFSLTLLMLLWSTLWSGHHLQSPGPLCVAEDKGGPGLVAVNQEPPFLNSLELKISESGMTEIKQLSQIEFLSEEYLLFHVDSRHNAIM